MKKFLLAASLLTSYKSFSQQADSTSTERFSVHVQATIISQYKPAFKAKYTGKNSLVTEKETPVSLTSTFYAGARLWRGASVFVNPEIAGGSGLSGAMGVAASTNGETFRIGNPEPKIYLARLFLRQVFALGPQTEYQTSDFNQLAGEAPTHYFSFTIGKVSIADYFDDNLYSHDPRTQFMSWGLMDTGAWDYPANTRGYTLGTVLEYVSPKQELRFARAAVPLQANGNDLNNNITQAGSQSLEYTRRYKWKNKAGAARILAFYTTANMGNYQQSIALNPSQPDITATRNFSNKKYGFTLNMEQAFTKNLGGFMRAGWNDGKNETWAFTEIDRTLCFGLSAIGAKWHRPEDNVGLAVIGSGISNAHRNYLQDGGKGFMLGDGKLNYGLEKLVEIYYSAALVKKQIFVSGAYQLVINPGYNKDRGPVNVYSIRLHTSI